MAFQLSLTFFSFFPHFFFFGLGCWRKVLREPNALGAWIKCSFIMKSIGDTEGCEGILLLIASERSACISRMSAFPLSHYCPAISATSSRCCIFFPVLVLSKVRRRTFKRMFHLNRKLHWSFKDFFSAGVAHLRYINMYVLVQLKVKGLYLKQHWSNSWFLIFFSGGCVSEVPSGDTTDCGSCFKTTED